MNFQELKQTEDGKRAAADADKMTKAQKIAEIMRIMMQIAGEPESAIQAMVNKCLQTESQSGSQKGGADRA